MSVTESLYMRPDILILTVILLVALIPVPAYGDMPQFASKAAYKQWKRAVSIYHKGERAEHQGTIDDALKLYEQAIAMYPDDPEFYLSAAILYQDEKHDYDRAEALMRRALELAPTSISINLAWATLLTDQGRMKEATAALKHTHDLMDAKKLEGR